MTLDELLLAAVNATTDGERAGFAQLLAAVDNIIGEIDERARSTEWPTRRLALHFLSRLAPPPAELTSCVIHCLHRPLSRDPLGEETVLVLVIAGVLAKRLWGYRALVAERVVWLDGATGERAPIVRKLALDTLAKIDAARAEEARRHALVVASIGAAIGERDHAAAAALVELHNATPGERDGYASFLWEEAARERATASDRTGQRICLESALEHARRYASGATGGGEGYERSQDVTRLEAELSAFG